MQLGHNPSLLQVSPGSLFPENEPSSPRLSRPHPQLSRPHPRLSRPLPQLSRPRPRLSRPPRPPVPSLRVPDSVHPALLHATPCTPYSTDPAACLFTRTLQSVFSHPVCSGFARCCPRFILQNRVEVPPPLQSPPDTPGPACRRSPEHFPSNRSVVLVTTTPVPSFMALLVALGSGRRHLRSVFPAKAELPHVPADRAAVSLPEGAWRPFASSSTSIFLMKRKGGVCSSRVSPRENQDPSWARGGHGSPTGRPTKRCEQRPQQSDDPGCPRVICDLIKRHHYPIQLSSRSCRDGRVSSPLPAGSRRGTGDAGRAGLGV